MGKPLPALGEDACRICGKEDDEAFLVLCDGCDRPFHTYCHNGCMCCRQKPKGNFNRKPAVPEGDWFCKLCAGHLPPLAEGAEAVTSVFAWGDNEDGQLGLLNEADVKHVCSPTRVHQLDGIGIVQVASTETSTLVLCNDGNLYSVGTGSAGQLGHSDMTHERLARFRLIDSLVAGKRAKCEGRFKYIDAGRDFHLAVTEEGHAYTWGSGDVGQLGHQDNKNKKVPKKISALRELEIPVSLGVCGDDFIAMTSGELAGTDQFNTQQPGVFMSMGGNTHGQLGDGTGRNQWVPQLLNRGSSEFTNPANIIVEEPTEFLLGRDISAIAAGKAHVVAVSKRTKGLWTWGFGEQGQLGHPKPSPPAGQSKFFRAQFRVPRPRFVKALENMVVAQIACGGQHTLVLVANGSLFAFGSNEFGQLGLGATDSAQDKSVFVPVKVESMSQAGQLRQIVAGEGHSAALSCSGNVYTWGRGQFGQLGLGDKQLGPMFNPTKVSGIPAMKKIFSGPNQVFAVEYTDDIIPTASNASIDATAPSTTSKGSTMVLGAKKRTGAPSAKKTAAPKRGRK